MVNTQMNNNNISIVIIHFLHNFISDKCGQCK